MPNDPAWINADAGLPEYNARELRRLDATLMYPGVLDRFGARSGVRPGGLDAVTIAGTTVTVRDLCAVVYTAAGGTQTGPYRVALQQELHELDPADGSNDRIDAIDLQVQDDDEDASLQRRAHSVYAPGTPAAVPDPPALTANSVRLATVLVSAGGTPSPALTYVAPYTVALGGLLPIRDASERPTVGLYEGMALVRQDTGAVEVRWGGDWPVAASVHGFQLRETLTFTSSGSFIKANHPGVRAVRIKCQAGGGGGGGVAATTSSEAAAAGGGGGGGYAEAWVPESALSSSETVTVGGAGNGGAAGANSGTSGGSSSVGAHCAASGGTGGGGETANGTGAQGIATGGTGGSGTIGQTQVSGSDGQNGRTREAQITQDGNGGASHMGGWVRAPGSTGSSSGGSVGKPYGGGGSGALGGSNASAAEAGGDGASGVVTIEVYV